VFNPEDDENTMAVVLDEGEVGLLCGALRQWLRR